MKAFDLLTELRQRGVELQTNGSQLRYRPKDALTPDQRAAIREHKAEILALLPGETVDTAKGEVEPSRWARLADSGLHHNDVHDLAQVLFLFAIELIADPDRAREDRQALTTMWAHYASAWKERIPKEAFEELEVRYQRRLQNLGLQDEASPPQGP